MATTRFSNSSILNKSPKYGSMLAGYPGVMPAPTAADGGTGTSATVSFSTVPGATSYTAISTPGSFTGSGTTSPITVSGLTAGTSYTFQIRANNVAGSGVYSEASNSVTPVQPGNFDSIATISGNGSATSLTFSNINSLSSSYKALQIRALWNYTSGGPAVVQTYMNFNNDNAVNYYAHYIWSNGASVLAGSENGNTGVGISGIYIPAVPSNEGPMGAAIIDITGFNNTSQKTVARILNGANLTAASTDSAVSVLTGMWNNTSNVTSISFQLTGGRAFSTATRISLYGITG